MAQTAYTSPSPFVLHDSSRPSVVTSDGSRGPQETQAIAGQGSSLVEPCLFCHRCSTNQQIQLELLSAFDEDEDKGGSSSHASSSRRHVQRTYETYKADLDRRYPILCENCRPAVEGRIKQRDDTARRWIWKRWMERDRTERSGGNDLMSRSHGYTQRAGHPARLGKGGRIYDGRETGQRKQHLRSMLETLRWALVALGPLSTVSPHTPPWLPSSSTSPLYGELPSWGSHKTLLLIAVVLNTLCAAERLLVHKSIHRGGGADGDSGSDSRLCCVSRLSYIHLLSALQCIEKGPFYKAATSVSARTWSRMLNINSLVPHPDTCDLILLTCQLALILSCLYPLFGTAAPVSQPSQELSHQKTQKQDVFDSLAHSLSQVTDSIFDSAPCVDGSPAAVFGQTSWSRGPNGLPSQPGTKNAEHSFSASSFSSTEAYPSRSRLRQEQDRMEIDDYPLLLPAVHDPARMDWQPTSSRDPHSQQEDHHRYPVSQQRQKYPDSDTKMNIDSPPSSSPSSTLRFTTLGPQKFYVPEEPIGGLEESFSNYLSLSSENGLDAGRGPGLRGGRGGGGEGSAGGIMFGKVRVIVAIVVTVTVAVAMAMVPVERLLQQGLSWRQASVRSVYDERGLACSVRRWAQEQWLALVNDNVQS